MQQLDIGDRHDRLARSVSIPRPVIEGVAGRRHAARREQRVDDVGKSLRVSQGERAVIAEKASPTDIRPRSAYGGSASSPLPCRRTRAIRMRRNSRCAASRHSLPASRSAA